MIDYNRSLGQNYLLWNGKGNKRRWLQGLAFQMIAQAMVTSNLYGPYECKALWNILRISRIL